MMAGEPGARDTLARSYDRVAAHYAAQFHGELVHKPLDRALLACFVEQVGGLGSIADLGCGPGQIARFVSDLGVPAIGIDISAELINQARILNPGMTFLQGNMTALDIEDDTWGGITAFYSIIHLNADERLIAFAECFRALRPGGLLLIAFHVGAETLHLDTWWDEPVSLDFHFLEPDAIVAELAAAGFALDARIERAPYPGVEHPSRRCYLFARKGAD